MTTTATYKLDKIKSLIDEYHLALDKRAHGGVAQDKLTKGIEQTLEKPWVQGEELKKLDGQS